MVWGKNGEMEDAGNGEGPGKSFDPGRMVSGKNPGSWMQGKKKMF